MSRWGTLLNDAQTAQQEEDAFGEIADGSGSDEGGEEVAESGFDGENGATEGNAEEAEGSDPFGGSTNTAGGSPTKPLKRGSSSTYLVNGPPPLDGRGAPTSASCIVSVNVPTSERQQDIAGKPVVWYQVHVRTASHIWHVVKRYSDCKSLHDALSKIGVNVDNFPGKQFLATQDDAFINKRRSGLDSYFRSLLYALKQMEEKKDHQPLLMKAAAGFNIFMDFCRVSSRSNSNVVGGGAAPADAQAKTKALLPPTGGSHTSPAFGAASGPKPSSHSHRSAGSGSIPMDSRRKQDESPAGSIAAGRRQDSHHHHHVPRGPMAMSDQPHSRVLLIPKVRFVVILYLPGVSMSDVYVGPNIRDETSVVVGGEWANPDLLFARIAGPTSSLPTPGTAKGRDSSGSNGSAGNRSGKLKENVLLDTVPQGEFEMVFDIPPQFDRENWKSDFAEGVLYLVWDAKPPQQTSGRARSSGPNSARRASASRKARSSSVKDAGSRPQSGPPSSSEGSRKPVSPPPSSKASRADEDECEKENVALGEDV